MCISVCVYICVFWPITCNVLSLSCQPISLLEYRAPEAPSSSMRLPLPTMLSVQQPVGAVVARWGEGTGVSKQSTCGYR